ncbi:hypothetical protein D0Z07_9098 [Hyphodiscus hymeniophilus]|uniref:DUF7923 domain-containing protein n=1 Tax=Hyphodiscus hymeniophilus TaxID=353542 RepID=A0A9P6SML5_9HELO|nr:hypothetical protein D0Z07_9098 [Hyphodiscus hymeniophilus]
MATAVEEKNDYRRRFEEIRSVENLRDVLVEEVLAKLSVVTSQLDAVTTERAREVSVLEADLESEKEARRGWQDKAASFRQRLLGMVFHEDFVSRGLQGGYDAADKFVGKVREHLSSLSPPFEDAKTVPIMVKAFANRSGLAHAYAGNKKVVPPISINHFWIGFSRRYPLVDFVDVGLGKEEADNKLREVLAIYIGNPQCQHMLLGCCNDAGYVPVLRPYVAQASISERITLLSAGPVQAVMENLGFRITPIFEPLFISRPPLRAPPSNLPGENGSQSVKVTQPIVDSILASSSSSSSPVPEKPVKNCGRLRPIIRNGVGKRIDKPLSVDQKLVQTISKRNLCYWHYLRADCMTASCSRKHEYPRPLSPGEYDALWHVARQGMCYRLRNGVDCTDDQCLYGHGLV